MSLLQHADRAELKFGNGAITAIVQLYGQSDRLLMSHSGLVEPPRVWSRRPPPPRRQRSPVDAPEPLAGWAALEKSGWRLDGQPTGAFVDKPVYILTSRRTFSAAESFTFGLKVNDRVTLVGERTGGGGHFGDEVAVSGDLRLFMPGGRTYDPETGEGWEAEGIAPDVEVPYAAALEQALETIRAR